jgi:hypothetical protein
MISPLTKCTNRKKFKDDETTFSLGEIRKVEEYFIHRARVVGAPCWLSIPLTDINIP